MAAVADIYNYMQNYLKIKSQQQFYRQHKLNLHCSCILLLHPNCWMTVPSSAWPKSSQKFRRDSARVPKYNYLPYSALSYLHCPWQLQHSQWVYIYIFFTPFSGCQINKNQLEGKMMESWKYKRLSGRKGVDIWKTITR